jgi:hypothetical protein
VPPAIETLVPVKEDPTGPLNSILGVSESKFSVSSTCAWLAASRAHTAPIPRMSDLFVMMVSSTTAAENVGS